VCLVPLPADAASPLKTKIVFDIAAGQDYSRHWSLDATSVPPVSARGRLLYFKPLTGSWVGAPYRTVTVLRGTPESGVAPSTWKVRTDPNGYFRVTMAYADKYEVKYLGTSAHAGCSATRYRRDVVDMERTTTVCEDRNDASSNRLTVTTDYRYNPYVAQENGHVSLWSTLGVKDSAGKVTVLHEGEVDMPSRPFTGSARCTYSVVIPADTFVADKPVFVSKVTYPGRYSFSSEGPADAPILSMFGPRPPANLWRPPADSVPTTGTYVYLKSDIGDYVGAGRTYLYGPSNSYITVRSTGGRASVRVDGSDWWNGEFKLPATYGRVKPGYYNNLTRYPFHDPAIGGLSWSGNGRGSNTLTGWFVVDNATYIGDVLTELDLRFEQHSEGKVPALRGEIHWVSTNPPVPPGPTNPVPDTLWQAPLASMPETSAYVYLDSDEGDYIGQGLEYLYTPADSIGVSESNKTLNVSVGGWSGQFALPEAENRFEPGYYGYLTRVPFHDRAQGGLSWSGNGRGSNTLTGWYVVDDVTYTDGVLTAIDLRFEQHSEGRGPALHGYVHWTAP